MAWYKYTSVGASLSGRSGKVSYLHDGCHAAMVCSTAGPEGERQENAPPPASRCRWCSEPMEVKTPAAGTD